MSPRGRRPLSRPAIARPSMPRAAAPRIGTICRGLAASLLIVLSACNAPDYAPVRDWTRSASLAADYPAAAEGLSAPDVDGVAAMQEALVAWLSALGRMADDGVQPYPENPFVDLAARAARTDPRAGGAIAALGQTLRHATRNNERAPALRDTIRGSDTQVQVLVGALKDAVAIGAPTEGPSPAQASEPYPAHARCAAPVPEATTAGCGRAAVRARYIDILTQVADGHAMLKAQARDITDEATVQRIRAAEDQLRRATRTLPLPTVPLPTVPLPASQPAVGVVP
jgi:hypothetical protein